MDGSSGKSGRVGGRGRIEVKDCRVSKYLGLNGGEVHAATHDGAQSHPKRRSPKETPEAVAEAMSRSIPPPFDTKYDSSRKDDGGTSGRRSRRRAAEEARTVEESTNVLSEEREVVEVVVDVVVEVVVDVILEVVVEVAVEVVVEVVIEVVSKLVVEVVVEVVIGEDAGAIVVEKPVVVLVSVVLLVELADLGTDVVDDAVFASSRIGGRMTYEAPWSWLTSSTLLVMSSTLLNVPTQRFSKVATAAVSK